MTRIGCVVVALVLLGLAVPHFLGERDDDGDVVVQQSMSPTVELWI